MKRYTLTFGAAETTKSVTISDVPATVDTSEIKVTIANWTNAVTATFEIDDPDGTARYSIAALPKGAATVLMISRKIQNGYVYKVTLSGVPGGSGGNVTIDTELT